MLPANRLGYRSNGEYYPLKVMVTVMFVFQACWVGSLLYRQCTSDIFLVDWEKVQYAGGEKVNKKRDILAISRIFRSCYPPAKYSD